jgi:uncharacterized repeat protein (TIGR02543 family)
MLVAEDYPDNLADINLTDIAADPDFNDVMSVVCSTIEAGEDPALSAVVQQAVEDFLYPPAPTPPPPTPTYTVTYNGNTNTGGTVPSDANNYEQGDSVTVLGNTGNLVKTQDGISLLFTGWNTAADGSGTSYNEADTFSMGSANVTLYAQWSAITATGPAGGLIFYDKGSVSDGWRYLEAAPSDQSTGGAEWGCYETSIPGADGTAVGTGKQNTIDIENGCPTAGIAARLCTSYDGGGYDDWFLPSRDELNLMYENLKVAGVGGFAGDRYWSSSEVNATHARDQDFSNGGQHSNYKSLTLRVRAVRAFRSTAPTYLVNYNANGATDGTVPSDGYHYEPAENVMVLHNTGNLVKTGYTFDGWNTAADGNGTDQAEGSTFPMGISDMTLYAKWAAVIDIAAIPGVTAPVTGATPVTTPVTTITATAQYTGTVTWSPNDSTFAGTTVYTATIILTAKAGFTLMGVTANFFTVADATTDTNPADSGIVTAVFPATATAAEVTVGDSYGGGIVAYILQSGDPSYVPGETHGLIAATADQSAGIEWIIGGSTQTTWVNGVGYGGTSTAYGTGQANTNAMKAQTNYTGGAAKVCDDYTNTETGTGVYSDWFLPSQTELDQLYLNKVAIGGFDTGYGYYSSSSEYDAEHALSQHFSDGQIGYGPKGSVFWMYRVRAVRAF